MSRLSCYHYLSLIPFHVFRFVLDCRLLGGDPLPSYSWFKDGSLLTPEMIQEDQGLDLVSDREHSQLDFLDPAPHHEGYYHCEANNTLGKINKHLIWDKSCIDGSFNAS